MRPILASFLVLAGFAHAQVGAPAAEPAKAVRTAPEYYAAGVAAEKAGDPDAARSAYVKALQANPRHAQSRYRLNQLKTLAPALAAKGRETQIGSVMIPEIKLDEATVRETLDLLASLIEKHSDGKVTPNFIVQDPTGKLNDRTITLQLKSVPAKAVLEYLTSQAGAKLRFDEHAVVILPR